MPAPNAALASVVARKGFFKGNEAMRNAAVGYRLCCVISRCGSWIWRVPDCLIYGRCSVRWWQALLSASVETL